jgi:hypothetical protein
MYLFIIKIAFDASSFKYRDKYLNNAIKVIRNHNLTIKLHGSS